MPLRAVVTHFERMSISDLKLSCTFYIHFKIACTKCDMRLADAGTCLYGGIGGGGDAAALLFVYNNIST